MQKWEHEALPAVDNSLTEWDNLGIIFNSMGKNGWELVSVDNGIAYFKRPLRAEAVIADINVHPEGENLGPYPHVGQGVYGD